MELKIYSQSGALKLTVSTSSSSTWNQELMTENALSASWVHPEYVPLDVNDYVLLEGVKFSIKKEYKPKQKNKQTYNYSVKFYAPIHDAEQVMYLNLTDGQYEPQFSLDGSPREHLQKWVDNMNRIYGEERWLIGDVIEAPNQTIEYSSTKCWDSLGSMAEAFATEWWSDGFYINLCRCERGERVELGYMQGLTSLTQTENSDDVKFFTRLLPLGSTKNIDRSRYGFSRLQLPNRAKYVDRNTNYGLYEHVESEAFAGIYPHYTGTVTSVRTEEKTGEDKKPFTVYFFKDSGMGFDPSSKENEIGGLVKHVSFQTGDLAGRDFEANYNSTTKEWEIINTYPDEDRQIPGGNLIPAVGNKYIPWNFKMPVEYEKQAEQDYKVAVDNFLAKYSEDIAKYGGESDYTHIDRNAVPLVLGQSVRLLSDKYFPGIGHRDSRMTKVVRKLDNLSIATIECTNQVGKGWKKTVDDSVRNLQYVVGEALNQAVIDVLKSWDGREPSEYNVFSALASIKEITTRSLSRIKPDETEYLINFLGGLISDSIKSTNYSSGALGSGHTLQTDPETGDSYLEVDRMLVRKVAYFIELVIKQLRHAGGELILTPASMKCINVEEQEQAYRCYFEHTDGGKSVNQEFVIGDQARAQTFNIKEGTSQNVRNTYYWRLVTGVGEDYIDLSKTDCDAGSGVPASGDDIVQLGNRNDATRQSGIILSTVGEDAPSIKQYKGINSYSLKGKEVTVLSASLNKFIGEFISIATGKSYDDMFDEMHTDIDKVKQQTDKEYTLWFFEHEPSLSNIPAVEWTTEELKLMHEQDMFYNRSSGFAYRFEKNEDGSYSWNDITDQQTIKALENASKAQDTADGKRRGFISQPTDAQAYDVGDIWTNATYPSITPYVYENDTLVCKTSKPKGEAFNISHWKPAAKYTTSEIKNLGDSILLVVSDNKNELSGLITQNQQSTNSAIANAEAALSDAASAMAQALTATDNAGTANTNALSGISNAASAMAKALEAFNNAGTAQDSANDANAAATANAAAIELTDKKITSLVAKVTFDANGNITNIDKSGLVTTADMNALITEKFTFDASGKVVNISTSGLVTEASFAGMFAAQTTADGLVKQADISVFITLDQAGNLISNATIQADKINFLGKTTINGNFVVDIEGNVTMSNATVTGTIIANSGKVGGFKISGNGLTNVDDDGKFTNDAYIIFRNDLHGCFAGIGGNILPATSGLRGVAQFENHDKSDWWGLGSNYAMLVSAQGSDKNCAIAIGGGYISGLAYKTRNVSTSLTLSRSDVSIACANTSLITITLPEMNLYDDGHVIKIKRLNGGRIDNLVKIVPGNGWHVINGAKVKKGTYIHVNEGDHMTQSNPLIIASVGDAMELVYHRDLNNETQYGCWVQYKHPREW